MIPLHILQRCRVLVWWGIVCWLCMTSGISVDSVVAAKPTRVMVVFEAGNYAGAQVAEQVLVRALQQRGYHVLDHHILTSPAQRERDASARSPQATAQQLAARLGVDIVISGYAQVHIQEKTYSTLDGKKVIMSQADVGARAVMVSTGHILLADHAQARKPFDAVGTGAVEQAAGALANKLLVSLAQLHAGKSTDSHPVIFHSGLP